MFYGTDWEADPNFFKPTIKEVKAFDLIIGCVDKAAFRVELGRLVQKSNTSHSPKLWLEMGNGKHAGQCVLGHVISGYHESLRLPTVFDLYPDLANPQHDNDESIPRCSLAEVTKSHQRNGTNSGEGHWILESR